MVQGLLSRFVCWTLLAAVMLAAGWAHAAPALAGDPSPFDKLAGRWLGEGRFGIRDGGTEEVKCRVTYIVTGSSGDELKQTIRCAAPSGSIEVQSLVTHSAGKLRGTWKELSRDMSGDLTGEVTPKGYRVTIKGTTLSANMTIILVNDTKQVVEIQFVDSALIGLTLILQKG
jgi:hypothetical protein